MSIKEKYFGESEIKNKPKKKLILKIAEGVITTRNLANGSVVTSKIADGSVTTDKLGILSVTTEKIADGAIITSKVINRGITTEKIADSAIVTDKIADGSVVTDKINDSAITNSKLANDSVNAAKISDNSVTTSKVADGNITTDKIANKSVTTDKLADSSVTASKLADGSINADKFADRSISNVKLIESSVTLNELAPDVHHAIATIHEGGIALTNDFGNSEDIGITQKALTVMKDGLEGSIADINAVLGTGGSGENTIIERVSDLEGDKADKVSAATNGHLAGLNASGNLTDSGIAPNNLLYQGANQGTAPDVEFDPMTDTVHVTEQTLSPEQQSQVRTNIGIPTDIVCYGDVVGTV